MGWGIILIAAGWLGVIPVSDLLELEASLCCPTMLFPYDEALEVHPQAEDQRQMI